MVPRAAIEWSAATYDGRTVRGGQTRSAYAGTETSAATPVNVPDLVRPNNLSDQRTITPPHDDSKGFRLYWRRRSLVRASRNHSRG